MNKTLKFLLYFASINFIPSYSESSTSLYLDLMKKCLINSIYQDKPLCFADKYEHDRRENGKDWPSVAHTMIGLKRLNNIQFCVEDILKNNIPGDLIEAGVWRGGATIFMRAILKSHNDTNRTVWVADSFEGIPDSTHPMDQAQRGLHLDKRLAISKEEVSANFQRYDLLDNQVRFLKGWFKDTLPIAPIKQLALMRLDGDLYSSTMDSLEALYPKLSIGGYVIIDDYGVLNEARQAVHEYREKHNIHDKIHWIDHSGVYWKKKKAIS